MKSVPWLHQIPPSVAAELREYVFVREQLEPLVADLAAGAFPAARNRLTGHISPPRPEDITAWSDVPEHVVAAGLEAIQLGRVGVVILNGGMATRFGGVVKGTVPVRNGVSFLGLQLSHLARLGARGPVFLMCSFATLAPTQEHLREHAYFGFDPARLHLMAQNISVRVTPEGQPFLDEQRQWSLYAPGHGDLFETLHRTAAFRAFCDGGGESVLVCNVDNLGAGLHPRVVGFHRHHDARVTVEVAPRWEGDKGGAPARVDDAIVVVEAFRFPPDFPIESIPVFNTNTMVLDVGAARPDVPLTWFRVDKDVDGRTAVQFERLMGEITSFERSAYLAVPREGPASRFVPVKTPEDLAVAARFVAQRDEELA